MFKILLSEAADCLEFLVFFCWIDAGSPDQVVEDLQYCAAGLSALTDLVEESITYLDACDPTALLEECPGIAGRIEALTDDARDLASVADLAAGVELDEHGPTEDLVASVIDAAGCLVGAVASLRGSLDRLRGDQARGTRRVTVDVAPRHHGRPRGHRARRTGRG
jgi:hypothetical protein